MFSNSKRNFKYSSTTPLLKSIIRKQKTQNQVARKRKKRKWLGHQETTTSSWTISISHALIDIIENDQEIFPISDEKYAEELQLQEALMASALSSRIKTPFSETQDDDHNAKPKRVKTETGESSQMIFCPICMDAKPTSEMFKNTTCSHPFCLDCISKHVAVKIQDNISTVKCPDLNCQGVLHLNPEFCR